METIETPIAERHLTYKVKNGESYSFYFAIGPCRKEDNGFYHCPLLVSMNDKPRVKRSSGLDSYEALIDAIRLLMIDFRDYQKDGNFYWNETEIKEIVPMNFF